MGGDGKKRMTGCPVAYGLDAFGDKWSLLIIRDLMLNDKKTFKEFVDAGEGIATNILADRLRHLEGEKIVSKSRDPQNRRSFIYALTEKGRDLAPVVIDIVCWSGKHDTRSFARKGVLKEIQRDREGFEKAIRANRASKSAL